jgi:Holliday junction resolvase RusA-like endonuclease
MVTHRLLFKGPVPGKKDSMHPRKDRKGYYLDPIHAAQIEALMWQARKQWTGKEPIEKPQRIATHFFVLNGRSDLDSKYTTIQDVLVKARVIRNDSIARVKKFSAEAEIAPDEQVVIEIEV